MTKPRLRPGSLRPQSQQSFYTAPMPPDEAQIQSLEDCMLPSKPAKWQKLCPERWCSSTRPLEWNEWKHENVSEATEGLDQGTKPFRERWACGLCRHWYRCPRRWWRNSQNGGCPQLTLIREHSVLSSVLKCGGVWTGMATLNTVPLGHLPALSSFPGHVVLADFCLPNHPRRASSLGHLLLLKQNLYIPWLPLKQIMSTHL